jgi:hypothetical protein
MALANEPRGFLLLKPCPWIAPRFFSILERLPSSKKMHFEAPEDHYAPLALRFRCARYLAAHFPASFLFGIRVRRHRTY